jgi:hypothetical protein
MTTPVNSRPTGSPAIGRRAFLCTTAAGLGVALTARAQSTLDVAHSVSDASAHSSLDAAAESYVKLVLAVGQHDPDYVDAYFGPPEWKAAAEQHIDPLERLAGAARGLLEQLRGLGAGSLDPTLRQRHTFLTAQCRSLDGRIALLAGQRMTFDEESRLIYDTALPQLPASLLESTHARLAALLPGDGPLLDRLEHFENRFVLPREKVPATMDAAMAECRRRTRAHIELPEGESCRLEYVTGQPWSAYNWYQGGAQSLIQINLDLPFRLAQADILAAHEGYPGHHVSNSILEQVFARDRGWVEFRIVPLFVPSSVISEGIAEYAIEMVFPLAERIQFAREVLFPLVGFDPADAASYHELKGLKDNLDLLGAHISRRYLNDELTHDQALGLLMSDALRPRARAEQSLAFAKRYRAYLVTYFAGYDLVKKHVESTASGPSRAPGRWDAFLHLLSSPVTPGDLR